MRKRLAAIILSFALILGLAAPAAAIEIGAQSAILIDAATGRVLYQKNAHQVSSVASLTKVMTALVALEESQSLSQPLTLPDDFVNVGESGIYLQPGETHSLEDMLYALLLGSANDAAQAIAIGVAGSEAAFVQLMNERTALLGLTDSVWANPHGLDQLNHQSTAYDMAMICREAMFIPEFNVMIATDTWNIPWPGNEFDREIYNHNRFLSQYEGADGIKTGYTDQAGNCLAASVTRDGMRLIGVVLNSEDHYGEMTAMMDYGFERFRQVEIMPAGEVVGEIRVINGKISSIRPVLSRDASIVIPVTAEYTPEPVIELEQSISTPFTATTVVGSVTYTDNIGTETVLPVYAGSDQQVYTFWLVFREAWQKLVHILL
ncbi:MAG: D-alanyl-D-alanine carboxypeptidase family protein [Bacillota bacterium]|nr:D-alanyl-D-alanine carboxypeptidase family protein [Bacillota bacterium]